jgi:predicted metallo-beta-lactamase superfamily hydrolase
MKITPVAADSMGCRSMATFVEADSLSILINPGADLAKLRFGHAPHQLEAYQLEKHLDRIHLYTESARMCIITRYTRTYFSMDHLELLKDKVLLLKNPNGHIHVEERKKAFDLLKRIKGLPREVIYIDGRSFDIGPIRFSFSDPVEMRDEGETAYTVSLSIRSKETTFVHTSGCQGLGNGTVLDFIRKQKPNVLYLDGPPLYQMDTKESQAVQDELAAALETLCQSSDLKEVILDHHFIREQNWQTRMKILSSNAAKHAIRIRTAAEFRGEENNPFESRRNQLYERDSE